MKLKVKLDELKDDAKKQFKKDDVMNGFETKKALENLFERIEALEKLHEK